jgi:pimeloyl-ACP methyl ester carboxylesterase
MDVWDPLMIAELAEERRVIVFDNRGVGGSTDDPSVPMTIDLLANDTAGLIKALGLQRPDVLGWSLGGYIAQRLIELHPERVRRLVLISTDPGGANAILASPDVLALDALVTTGQASIDEIFSLLFPPDQLPAGQAWFDRYLSQPGCCESVSQEVGLRQLDAEAGWQTGPGAWGGLTQIHRPTLIMRGALDIDVPPMNEQLIASRIRNAVLVTFDSAGHGLPLQEPELVSGLVNGFLRDSDTHGRQLWPSNGSAAGIHGGGNEGSAARTGDFSCKSRDERGVVTTCGYRRPVSRGALPRLGIMPRERPATYRASLSEAEWGNRSCRVVCRWDARPRRALTHRPSVIR